MSEENVEIVRAMYEGREGGDMDASEFVHPEIEFARIGADLPGDEGEWHGLDGMKAASIEYLNVWGGSGNELRPMPRLT